MVTRQLNERFQNDAQKYAAYLETPEGQLRTDLAFANLMDSLLSPRWDGMHVLDVGCGTGAIGIRLALLGCHVTLLDSSEGMLTIARRASEDAGIADRVVILHGDAFRYQNLFPAASFDLIICHNVLEFLDDPAIVLRGCARALRDQSAILSIVVRNQAGEVFKAALQSGDLAASGANLTAGWACESLYGEKVRLFTADGLLAMLKAESLEPIALRGIRVVADYLPPSVSRADEYEEILDLEKKLGSRPEFAHVARYIQVLSRPMERSS